MKDKPMYQIVQMAEDELSPKADVRVLSQRKQEIYPNTNLMLSEKDKYAVIGLDMYQKIYDLACEWDTFDMVQFTLQWPNDRAITITRGFFFEVPEMPIIESVVMANGIDAAPQGQMYVRQDILATYDTYVKAKVKTQPNVRITADFMYELHAHQDLNWDHILASYSGKLDLQDLMLNKTFKGVENFVRAQAIRRQVKFILEEFMPEHKVASMKASAQVAIKCGLNSLVDAITHQVYGKYTDENLAKVLSADVHFSSLGLVTHPNENHFSKELVYAVIKDDQLYLTFGALDLEDGINDLRVEFDLKDEDVTKDTVKVVEFIYPNLV